ncbi:MAG: hypothetical protein AB7O32_01900 [Vicinamibacterales bacterium]
MPNSHDRRAFLTALASLTGVATTAAPALAQGQAAAASSGRFDLAWLDQLKGRHKQVYDLGAADLAEDARVLRFPRNFLDTFRDELHLESPDVNTIVGISNVAFPINATDRLWAKYKLGERATIIDPATKQPAVRNIFYEGGDISVKTLQARGTIFWQCNIALGSVAQRLATSMQLPVADVRADLAAGLNPGVRVMPSHVMALALAQERGFTYMKP